MVSVCPIRGYSNYQPLKFRANQNNNKKQELHKHDTDNIPQHPKSKNGLNKTMTGLLTSTAFILGMQTGNMTQATTKAPHASNINITPNKSQNSESTIAFEDALQQNTNTPPKLGRRMWTTQNTFTVDGVNYIAESKYSIQETPFLIEQKILDKQTKKMVQRNEYSNYELAPQNQKTYDSNNNLIETRDFTGFNPHNMVAESAKINSKNGDGWTKSHVSYRMVFAADESNIQKGKDNQEPTEEEKLAIMYGALLDMLYGK